MAYSSIERRGEQNVKQNDILATKRFVIERKPDSTFFYELEEAVVLDIILDESHPMLAGSTLDPEKWPPNIDGSAPSDTDPDYSWIGKIKFRCLKSEVNVEKQLLNWAAPLENTGVVEYPLINEIVIIGKYMDQYFYTRKINASANTNSNALIYAERIAGGVEENLNEYTDQKMKGPTSTMSHSGGPSYSGVLGSYFKFNSKIRSLRPFEGDTIIQSRFGSSIRFGAYDYNRNNDNGLGEYSDHGGNPMILIRNRQAPIKGPDGKTAKGLTLEDINKDGSSIHITSGKTQSYFGPNTTTGMINVTKSIKFPSKLDGDQIVFNSDRLIFSSRSNEMMFFAKKFITITTDQILSLNSYGNTTITSANGLITLNAAKIYLGFKKDAPNEQPAMKGRDAALWLYALCDWMLLSVNTQIQMMIALISHFHMGYGPTSPPLPPAVILWTEQLQSLYASQTSLIALRSQTSALMSSRVFLGG